jgi:NAD(P)-dependent dehydrogenase (short-subunit alcohol dehydrogenase family)
MSSNSLAGKCAIVTAGASGIGKTVIARMIANGARVATCDIEDAALASFKAEFPDVLAVKCDVANPAAVEGMVAQAIKHLGKVDILVNNAGSAGPTAGVGDIDPADWSRTLDVNLTSQFLFIRGVVAGMIARRDGCIINMSSAAGRLGMPMRLPYVAAKWGVIGITQSLAMELGQYNIRVNAILPGSVRGDRMDRVIRARAQATGRSIAEVEAEEVASISLGRMIEPGEIADLIVFVSSESGRSISGQSLGICGNTEVLR